MKKVVRSSVLFEAPNRDFIATFMDKYGTQVEMRLARADAEVTGVAHGVMAVQGVNEQLYRYWHFEDEGDSTDSRPHGVESSIAMADESLDLLNDVNSGGKGVAVGLSHEWISDPDPSVAIRDEQGHFRHNYQGAP